jgi:hypothetical protein
LRLWIEAPSSWHCGVSILRSILSDYHAHCLAGF